MLLARFTPEAEADRLPAHPDMLGAQGGETKGAVLAGIFLVAHADEPLVQQPDHRGRHALTREDRLVEVLLDLRSATAAALAGGQLALGWGVVALLEWLTRPPPERRQ